MMSLDKIKPLTRIRIKTINNEYEGLKIPSEEEKLLILKLDSGYNIGLKIKNIISIEVLEEPSKESKQGKKLVTITKNDSLTTIKLLHTGGTIASKVDYKTGGVVADFDPEAILELFPELKEIANIESEFLGNMFSDDFRFAHFNKIAKKIFEQYQKGKTKFIVTSGTDFLHYLSASLSFILKDLSLAVMVVGSQRSSDRGSSDAGINLICATQFLANTDFEGVAVCMHENSSDDTCLIIPGTNARKMHSSRRDAFKTINSRPIARIDYSTRNITLLKELPKKSKKEKSKKNTEIKLLNENLKIGMIYSRPNLFAEELKPYENFDALILIGSGLGHFPITTNDKMTEENEKIFSELKKLSSKIPLVMTSQTINGRINMNVYSPARKLQEIGILGNLSNMTIETTYCKLAYLLSTGIQKKYLADELLKNYCGEQEENDYMNFE